MQDIYRKIEREKQFINSARTMRQATDNPVMQQRVDTQIRESQRNLTYLEDRMRELQMRKINQGMDQMSLNEGILNMFEPFWFRVMILIYWNRFPRRSGYGTA